MKIQELAIIFVIIILPISLLLSAYTQFQIQTISMQTEYDNKLTVATYDAIKAFQLNAKNETYSDLAETKSKDLEASINSFRNSIMTGFELNGYTEEDLNNYIPALVYTLYDGFYIYSPYKNINYRYDENKEPIEDNGKNVYGLKPYINYSCRYVKGDIDVVITYALDNYITVQGNMPNATGKVEFVNKSGYLIDGIQYDETNNIVKYNNIEIKEEQLKENVGATICNYRKINGIKYYLYGNQIITISNGMPIVQYEEGDTEYISWKNAILNNDSAKQYYKEAYEFTKWFKDETELDTLTFANARDESIDNEGKTSITNIWANDNRIVFDFNNGTDASNNIENELSNFNQHKLAVIRNKIETNLAIAISNYNTYSGAARTNTFQMPELKENEWDNITHNISLISFLQGLPIGGKTYNGYSLVTNSESKEVILEENIYILGRNTINDKYNYHKIGDKGFENGTVAIDAGPYGEVKSAGRINLDFQRKILSNSNLSYYYYPLNNYNASYDSIVMQNNVTTYDDIYAYVNGQSDLLKETFYTALGRERASKFNIDKIEQINDEPSYIPEGYTHVRGTSMENGFVIKGDSGNEFVWIEVPRTTTVYPTAGVNITDFTEAEYKLIEADLKTYIGRPSATTHIDEYYEGIGLTEDEYYAQKKKILKSMYKNEGFYIGRYELGIDYAEGPRIAAGEATQQPVIKKNAYPYTYIEISQAQELAKRFEKSGYGTSMMFVIQWDLIIKYLESKGISGETLETAEIGNFEDSEYTITNPNAKYSTDFGNTWIAEIPYEKSSGKEVIVTTGTSEKHSLQNIYNLGGNVTELTLGRAYASGPEVSSRGGYYRVIKNTLGLKSRNSIYLGDEKSGTYVGTRVCLYKQEETVNTYTVTYNANGGEGIPQTELVMAGQYNISNSIPTREGHEFSGWSDGTKIYQPGEMIYVSSNVVLTAIWNPKIYTITFDANGGTGGPTSLSGREGETVTIPTEKPTRDGYKFYTWGESDNLLKRHLPGSTITLTQDLTLRAIWVQQQELETTCTITFNLNGGTGTFSSITVLKGTTVTLPTTIPTKSGYTFGGWLYPTPNALFETVKQPGTTITVNEDITLNAKWTSSGGGLVTM